MADQNWIPTEGIPTEEIPTGGIPTDGLQRALSIVGQLGSVTPPIDKVFEAFKYVSITGIKCVIIGQDPYPTLGAANGLAFSVNHGNPIPDSLRAIFKCLARSGLRPERAFTSGDLRPWAVQGVLLLNTALTTIVGESKSHASIWKPYIRELIEEICRKNHECGRRIPFMMWGNEAQKYADVVRHYNHVPLTWTHPSPLSDNKLPIGERFRMCTHFEMCRGIVWDNLAPIIALTDGSCPLNGNVNARASFAVILGGGPFNKTIIRGEVQPCEYQYDGKVSPTQARIKASNNRGELMGLIIAFHALIKVCALGDVEVVSDSDISIKTLLEWLPARLSRGTQSELKNLDLVMIAWKLFNMLKAQAHSVTLTHVRSHQKPPPEDASPRDKFIHLGNALADKHASLALTHPTQKFHLINAPEILADM